MFACGNLIVALTEKLVVRGAVSLSADNMLEVLRVCHEHGDMPTLGTILKAVGLAVEAFLINPKLGEVIHASEFMRLLREACHMLVTFVPTEETLRLPCSEFLRVVLECTVRTPNKSSTKGEVLDILITTQACFATLYLACIADPTGEVTRNSCVAIHCLAGELLQLRGAIYSQCNTELRHMLTYGMHALAKDDSGRFFALLTSECENPVILWNQTMRTELLTFLQRGLESGSFNPMGMRYSHNEVVLNGVYLRLFVQYSCWPLPDAVALFVAVIDSLHHMLCIAPDGRDPSVENLDPHVVEVTALTAIRLVNDHVGLIEELIQVELMLKFAEVMESVILNPKLKDRLPPRVTNALLQIVYMASSSKSSQQVDALASANPLIVALCQATTASFISHSREMLYASLYLLVKLTVNQRSAPAISLKSGLLFPSLLITLSRAGDADLQKAAVLVVVNLCVEKKGYDTMRDVLPELILKQLAADTAAGLQLLNSSISCPTLRWDDTQRTRAIANVEVRHA
jgi:hypothetical protein